MKAADFWSAVLDKDETLIWTGRPKPRLHWRNWRLWGPAPMAAAGLLAAAWFIIATYGAQGDMWLLVLPALLVLIPARATRRQLRDYAAMRYALTNRRALFFRVGDAQTRVRAFDRSAQTTPVLIATRPASVHFLTPDAGRKHALGFDYIEAADDLLAQLRGTKR